MPTAKKKTTRATKKAQVEAKPKVAAKPAGPRKLKQPKYQSFKMQTRIKQTTALPGALRLLGGATKVLFKNKKVFFGIIAVYAVASLILVKGFSGDASFNTIKTTLDQFSSGNFGHLLGGGLLFAYLLGSAGNTASATAGAYQLILTLVISLALVWTLRQVYAGNKIRIRDAFYSGMYPLVMFFLVLCTIGLQMVPAAIGVTAYGIVTGNGIASTGVEQLLWAMLLIGLILVSLYMLCSSVFALYIVCLPDMTPMRALRSARALVAARRWTVMRKLLAMPLLLLIFSGLIVIPLILYATPLASWVLFALTILLLPLVHGYVYRLYRSLL